MLKPKEKEKKRKENFDNVQCEQLFVHFESFSNMSLDLV